MREKGTNRAPEPIARREVRVRAARRWRLQLHEAVEAWVAEDCSNRVHDFPMEEDQVGAE